MVIKRLRGALLILKYVLHGNKSPLHYTEIKFLKRAKRIAFTKKICNQNSGSCLVIIEILSEKVCILNVTCNYLLFLLVGKRQSGRHCAEGDSQRILFVKHNVYSLEFISMKYDFIIFTIRLILLAF